MKFKEKNQEERENFVEFWANYIRENPSKWQKQLGEFLNAQIINSRNFHNKLLKTKGGSEKLIKLYNISNPKIIARLKNSEGNEKLKLYK